MSNKLSVISTKDNISPGSNVCISPNRQFSELLVKGIEEDWVEIKEGTRYRPLHLSEISKGIKERGWNLGLLPFESGGELWIGLDKSTSPLPPSSDLQVMENMRVSQSSSLDDMMLEIKQNEEYKKILEEMDEREINLFTTSSSEVNLVNGVQTIDVISLNSDSYTNMVSLVPLIGHIVEEGISGKVELGILYANSGVTYNYFTQFPAFSYTSSSLIEDPWVEIVEGCVQIEYISGVIRVLPLVSSVTECIISQCIVEYGRIEREYEL